MPITSDGYTKRTEAQYYNSSVLQLERLINNPATNETDVMNAFLRTQAQTLAENQEESLQNVYEAAYIEDATGKELTKKAQEISVIRRPATAATGVVEFSRDSSATQDYTIPKGTEVQTGGENAVVFVTTESVTLVSGTSSVNANAVAQSAGIEGNVAAGTVDTFTSGVSGIDFVTNPNPMGDPSFSDTNGETYRRGTDLESDENLRQRALDQTTSIGGAGTLPAIRSALSKVDSVLSYTIYVDQANDTIEPVVYGGTDSNVAQALFDVVVLTEETVGGVNGTAVSVSINSPTLASGSRTMNFSRPTVANVDLTIDLVYDDTYVGKEDLRTQLTDYIGGPRPDGITANGDVDVGEDVYLTDLEGIVEQDGNGVVGVTGITTTPSKTTDANGLEIISIADNEVAETDGTDGSITINETAQ